MGNKQCKTRESVTPESRVSSLTRLVRDSYATKHYPREMVLISIKLQNIMSMVFGVFFKSCMLHCFCHDWLFLLSSIICLKRFIFTMNVLTLLLTIIHKSNIYLETRFLFFTQAKLKQKQNNKIRDQSIGMVPQTISCNIKIVTIWSIK